MTEMFEMFAIVELMGRQIIAGRVTEESHAGVSMLRVDVPATETQPAFTKFYGGGSIYAVTPCDEKTMLAASNGLKQKPIDLWTLNIHPRMLQEPAGEIDDPEIEV